MARRFLTDDVVARIMETWGVERGSEVTPECRVGAGGTIIITIDTGTPPSDAPRMSSDDMMGIADVFGMPVGFASRKAAALQAEADAKAQAITERHALLFRAIARNRGRG